MQMFHFLSLLCFLPSFKLLFPLCSSCCAINPVHLPSLSASRKASFCFQRYKFLLLWKWSWHSFCRNVTRSSCYSVPSTWRGRIWHRSLHQAKLRFVFKDASFFVWENEAGILFLVCRRVAHIYFCYLSRCRPQITCVFRIVGISSVPSKLFLVQWVVTYTTCSSRRDTVCDISTSSPFSSSSLVSNDP